ncbi:MAG: hypothetical protein IKA62_03370 [Clostridia bacterium]|nr:hypothetical protein [Clostridia bacterium]
MKNTFVKVLSFLMALTMIVGMFSAITVSAADECTHTKGEIVKTVPPTCQTSGYTVRLCADCGEEYIPADEIVLASPEYHDIKHTEATAATCLKDATTAGKICQVEGCGYVPENEGVQVVAGSQKEHSFKRVKVAATCDAPARYEYVCAVCNNTAEKINELVNKTDEDGNPAPETKWVGTQTYEQFKATAIAGEGALNPDHTILTWEIVTVPVMDKTAKTCTDGLMKGSCAHCDYTEEKVIPVAHEFTINLNPNNSACADYVSGFACAICGEISSDAVVNEEPTEHANAGNKVFTGKFTATLPTKLDGSKFTFAELEALGFELGDDFYKASTCTETGYALTECLCGQIYIAIIPVDADAHKDANLDWGDTQWPTTCTEAAVKVGKCVNYAVCGYEKTTVVYPAAASAHKIDNKTEAPTCTDVGYSTAACTNKFVSDGVEVTCAHGREADGTPSKFAYKDELGHTWGEPTYKSGVCGSAVYEKQCSVCEVKEDVAEPEGIEHVYTEIVVPANCASPEFVRKICTICEHTVDNAPAEGAEKDETVHVYDITVAASIVAVVKAPTCTATGITTIKCANPACTATAVETSKNVETAKIAHTEVSGSKIEWDEANETWVVTSGQTNATCQAVGYKNNGKFCTVCGATTKAPTEIKVDATAHVGTKTLIGTTASTCQADGTNTYTTTCCGIVTEKNAADPKWDACFKVTKNVPYKAPTCTEAGNHAYVACAGCDAYKPLTVVTTGCSLNCSNHQAINDKQTNVYTIAALGHDWVKQDAVPEDCDTNGTKEYFDCSRCTLVTFDKVKTYDTADDETDNTKNENLQFLAALEIVAHGATYNQKFTAVAATCTSTGIAATKADGSAWCTKCDVNADGTGKWITPKAPHTDSTVELNKTTDDNYDCTKPHAVVTSCTVCGNVTAYDFDEPAEEAHEFAKDADGKDIWVEQALATGEYSCKNDTMETRACTNANCKYTEERVKTAKTGCWTYKGATPAQIAAGAQKYTIDLSCDKISEFVGFTCGECGEEIKAEMAVHTIVSVDKDATCDEDGYHIEYCKVCNSDEVAVNTKYNKLDADGKHTFGADSVVLEIKPATPTEDGFKKYTCALCGKEAVEVIPASATIVITGTLSAEEVAAGTTVEYVVNFSGVDFEFNTLKLNIAYNSSYLTFVSASTTLEGAKVYTNVNADGLGITLAVPYSADGEEQKAMTSVDGSDVVTVVFQANNYAIGQTIVDVTKLNDAAYACEAAELKILGRGNLNGDTLVTVEDALAVSKKFGTADVYADINGDGIVDVDDFALVATFAASNQTAKDYLVMVGTYAEIAETIETLYETSKLADVNKDGRQDINDYWYITLYIEEALNDADYDELGFASVYELVITVMSYLALGTP